MKSQFRNFRRTAIAAVAALGVLGWHAAIGADVSRADDALRNDATAHIIAAFSQGRGLSGGEVVRGDTTVIDGATLATWAIVSRKDGEILAAGATLPHLPSAADRSKASSPAIWRWGPTQQACGSTGSSTAHCWLRRIA
ncbi:MAG: hypothetical protein WD648_16445 [Planctomycetaceae bacterium]